MATSHYLSGHYHAFGLKPAHHLVACQVQHFVVITKLSSEMILDQFFCLTFHYLLRKSPVTGKIWTSLIFDEKSTAEFVVKTNTSQSACSVQFHLSQPSPVLSVQAIWALCVLVSNANPLCLARLAACKTP